MEIENQVLSKRKKNNNRARVEKWLRNNQKFINFTAIEKEIDAPKGLLQKFAKYDKKIHDKWIDPLYMILQKMTSFSLRKN